MVWLRMLTPPRRVFLVLLPLQPQHQSMAASFHGSANIRCVSSPSGGLSSRLAYRSSAALFGFHGRSNIYYFICFDSSSTDLRRGLVSEVSGGKKKIKDTCTEISPHWSCHRPPPIRFPLLFWICMSVSWLADPHGGIMNPILHRGSFSWAINFCST